MFEQYDKQKELLDSQKEKPLDELQSAILETVSDCMLTNEEIAALLTSVMMDCHFSQTLTRLAKRLFPTKVLKS